MGRKLTVYMVDGTEYGPRIAEIGNWVGKGVYSPRASISEILHREEFNNPGIYFLKSTPRSEAFVGRIYIGEAENIGVRIKQHLNDPKKDFEELVFFISKDELLTKTQIKYLETQVIRSAHNAKAAEIENGNSPNLPTLHEADISDMEYFLEQMKLILPLMGFKFLVSTIVGGSEVSANKAELFKIKSTTLKASMYETDQGFIITKGSQASKVESDSMTDSYKRLRQKLIESGILKDKGNYFEFSVDTVFSSPSAASNTVLGRQSAGPIYWISKNNKTYKSLIEDLK